MDELIGPHNFGAASCLVVRANALPVKMRAGIAELTKLFTPEASRGKGDATQLLHNVCRIADRDNAVLMLGVRDDEIGLCAFYTRFGFQPIQAKPMLMARRPGATPVIATPITKALETY